MKIFQIATLAVAMTAPIMGIRAQEQRVVLNPIAVDAALTEFARVCLRDFPTASKVRNAIGKSTFGYQAEGSTAGQWRAPQAVVAMAATDGKVTKCDFDALLDQRIEPGVLAGMVQTRIERELGNRPPYHQVGRSIVWEWSFGAKTSRLTADFAGPERQLALSLTGVDI